MIISLRSISYEELKKNLTKNDKIVIWSCDLCIKHCGLGGIERVRILEDMLKEDGYDVIGREIISESCLINLVKKHRINNEEMFREATAIIVLACESGYESVKTVFKEKKVIETTRTVGAGNFTLRGKIILTSPLEWTGLNPAIHGYALNEVAEKLGLYPKLPSGTVVEEYAGVGGFKVSTFRVPGVLKVYVVCEDRVKGPIRATAIITPGESEVILSDRVLDALGIILIRPGEGLWRFNDDSLDTVRRSGPHEVW